MVPNPNVSFRFLDPGWQNPVPGSVSASPVRAVGKNPDVGAETVCPLFLSVPLVERKGTLVKGRQNPLSNDV